MTGQQKPFVLFRGGPYDGLVKRLPRDYPAVVVPVVVTSHPVAEGSDERPLCRQIIYDVLPCPPRDPAGLYLDGFAVARP